MSYNIILEFINGCIAISDGVDFIALLATNSFCLLKTSVIRIHREELSSIVESAIKDWSIVRDEKSRDLMREYAYRGRLISIFPLSIGLLSIVPLILYSLPNFEETTDAGPEGSNVTIIEMRNLIMGTGCSVADLPLTLYLAFYIFQCIQLVCMCCCNLGCDAIFFGISIHLCGQFNLLKINVTRLGKNREKSDIEEDLRAWIERHNHLLRLLNLVEDIFNVIIFGVLAATGSHIILLGMGQLII